MKKITSHTVLIGLLLIGTVLLTGGCKKCSGKLGDLAEETYPLSSFDALDIQGKFTVQLCQDSTFKMRVKALEGLMDNINYEVNDGVLKIENKNKCAIRTNYSDKVVLEIGCGELKKIEMTNPEKLASCGRLRSDRLDIKLKDCSPELDLVGEFDILTLLIDDGTPSTRLAGSCRYFKLENASLGKFDATELEASEILISSNSTSHIDLWAVNKLTLWLEGSEKIRYKGEPEVSAKIPSHSSATYEKL
ncbi:DUF2807 domain-containing protein [bacterium SCSIO 12741]|nr:DUF2807 domain-containing protein [bacterium SCSIO 12741]